MLKYSLMIVALLMGWVANAQKLDSLHKVAEGLDSYQKVKFYNQIGITHYKLQEYDLAVEFFQWAAETAVMNQLPKLSAEAYNNIGAIQDRLGNYRQAVINYEMAAEYFEDTNNIAQLAQARHNIGLAYKSMNLYREALDNLFDAASVLDSLNDTRNLSSAYNAIGNIHRDLGTMELSLGYLQKALTLRESIDYEFGVAQTLNNIGIWHFKNHELNEAQGILNQALRIKRSFKNKRSLASTLAKLGEVYMAMDSLRPAKACLKESLAIRQEYNDLAGISIGANHLATLYVKTNQLDSAKTYLNQGLELAKAGSLLKEQAASLKILKEVLLLEQNYEGALSASNQLGEINQEILNDESARYLMESEVRFGVRLKDREIALKQIEVSDLRNRNHLLLIIAIAFIIITLAFAMFLRATRNVAIERKKAKERVERLLSEMNHRTKNHLQAQSGLIKKQLIKLKDHSAKEYIKGIDNQIKAINLIHTHLYVSTEDSPENINLTTYIENIVENLMISFGWNRNQVDLDLNLEKMDIDVHKALPIGLILNESVTNAFKYAFKGKNTKSLSVELSQKDPEKVFLIIKDNGPGFSEDTIAPQSSGLDIMRSLAQDLSASFEIRNENGTIIELYFDRKK